MIDPIWWKPGTDFASGGEIQAESSDGQWRVTGGFWGMTLEELADRLIRDRFEDEGS